MFISYNWLRELTGTKLSASDIRERLTNVGLAVDAVLERGDDFVLDVEVPSNRGDCLSHFGIARELAVSEQSEIRIPNSKIQDVQDRTADFASVTILDSDLCPRYAARLVRGVKIGPSPEWLVKKIEAIGQRSINNVADITNYVLHELGQPLHAFDLAKLTENRIVVRRAASGETIKTLDGVDRELDSQMLVIADAKRPVAIAGVMGGEDSEISQATTDVLIESAYFNAASVRRTARVLGMHTEASHRFERGTDPEGVIAAQERCVSLICELAGGTVTSDALDVYPHPIASRTVNLRPNRVAAITGLNVAENETRRVLKALGFERRAGDTPMLTFTIPSWRHDVSIEEDLVEEVTRHTGYDRIATELPPSTLAGEYHFTEARKRSLRQALTARGFDEAINFSFLEAINQYELLPVFGASREAVTLTNPIIEEASSMRQTLIPGLLNSVRHNLNQGIRDVCLFEIGRLFVASPDGQLPVEREALTLVATGGKVEAGKAQPVRDLDFFDLKGALESAVEAMNLPQLRFVAAAVEHLHPGQAATISASGTAVGTIGRLAETISQSHKFRQPVYVAELDLTALMEIPERAVLYSPLQRFPSIVRDASLLVDRTISAAELLAAAEGHKTDLFAGVNFVGTYEGEGISDDKRSVTLRFEYRAADRTLRDEDVDAVHWPIVEALKKRFGAEVR